MTVRTAMSMCSTRRCVTLNSRWATGVGRAGDNATENTAAFTKALQAAANASGGVVFAPPGLYKFAGNLSVPPGVTLSGSYNVVPSHDLRNGQSIDDGTVLIPTGGRVRTRCSAHASLHKRLPQPPPCSKQPCCSYSCRPVETYMCMCMATAVLQHCRENLATSTAPTLSSRSKQMPLCEASSFSTTSRSATA